MTEATGVAAVIFDLDGVLLDSEGVWNAARKVLGYSPTFTWRELF